MEGVELFCERNYNRTNATLRALRSGVDNITRESYVQMCISRMKSNDSDVSVIIIVPYALIFLLSVVGNGLVILTLVRHKKMRTITNMYLLNLAVSDLLLAVFCMPFSLIPMLMQKFIFGTVVCVLIRYAQAVSVGVSCATLVAISLERFYAICHPLTSRRWQTLRHSYKVIIAIWLTSLVLMVPIAVFNRLMKLQNQNYACREIWPNKLVESFYQILLDVVLLALPLILMSFSYGRVAKELWSDISISTGEPGSPMSESDPQRQNGYTTPITQSPLIPRKHMARSASNDSAAANGTRACQVQVLRPAHNCRVLANKKRVVKMLCVVVLEYFICWTPLFLLMTWSIIDYEDARDHFTPLLKSAFLLLSYMSSCIHPITYCFMNKRFRQSFADAFRCCLLKRDSRSLYSEASALQVNGGAQRPPKNNFTIRWKRQT